MTTQALYGKNILIILRHANSVKTVQDFVALHEGTSTFAILDPIAYPHAVDAALQLICDEIKKSDIVVVGTKVFDTDKEESRLFEFLDLLNSYGIGNKPICLTHLTQFSAEEIDRLNRLKQSGFALFWCEDDNLGKNGMAKLGELILPAAEPLARDTIQHLTLSSQELG